MRSLDNVETLGATGTKTIAFGVTATGWGWLTSNEFLGLLGAAVAIIGLIISWHYKREAKKLKVEAFRAANEREERNDARREREHQMRMQIMQTQGIPLSYDTLPGSLESTHPEDEDDS